MKLIISIFFILTAFSFACSSKNSTNSSKNNPEAEKLINVSGDLSCETVNDLSTNRLIYTNIAKIPQDIRCRVENFANTSNPEASGRVSVASGIAKECSVINLSEKDSEGYQTLSVRLPEVTGQDYCRVMLIVKDAVSGESSPINSITYFYKEDLYEMVASNGDQNEVPETLNEAKFEIINRRTGLTVTDQVLESVSCLNYQAGSSEPVAGCPLDLAPSINGTISGSLAGAGSELYKVHFQGMAGDKVYQTKKPLLVHPGKKQPFLTLDRSLNGKTINSSTITVNGLCYGANASVDISDSLSNIIYNDIVAGCQVGDVFSRLFNISSLSDGIYHVQVVSPLISFNDSFSFTLDRTPASVSITNLAANDYIGSPRQPINGTCSEVGQQVKLSYAGKEEFAMCEEGGVWSSILHISSLPDDTPFNVSVSHQDAVLNAPSSQTINLIKDTSYPVLALATPVNGQIVDSSDMGALEVSGTCSKAGLVTVTHPMGSSQTACVDGAFSLLLDVSGNSDGTQRITAYMVDERGHQSASDMRLIVKDEGMPLLAVTSHQNGDAVSSNATVSGTCSEIGETVAASLGGLMIARANCLGDNTFALDLDFSGVVGENYALTFRHYSKALNKNSKLVYMTLEKGLGVRFPIIFNTERAFAALYEDGSVKAWGDPNYGGNTSSVNTNLTGINPVIEIVGSASSGFAALHQDGSVTSWGRTDPNWPYFLIDNSNPVLKIASSNFNFSAIHADGSITTWGLDASFYSQPPANSSPAVELFSAKEAFAALHEDGSVTTWGRWGADSSVGTALDGTNDVIDVSSTYSAFAALHADGSVTTWGGETSGGDSSTVASFLNGDNDVIKIFSTYSAFAALHADGSVTTWGGGNYGGNSSTVASFLNGDNDVIKIFSTYSAFAALHADGSVTTWGDSNKGGMKAIYVSGEPLVEDASIVEALNGDNDVIEIFSTSSAFAALHADGSVTTWGVSTQGGDSNAVQSYLVDVDTVYTNIAVMAIVQQDGTIVSWGIPIMGGVNGIVSFP